MSEDSVLTAAQGVAYIQGVQESDVAACAKHYAVNSQETDRLDVDQTVSERTLREIYLPAFEAAVQDRRRALRHGRLQSRQRHQMLPTQGSCSTTSCATNTVSRRFRRFDLERGSRHQSQRRSRHGYRTVRHAEFRRLLLRQPAEESRRKTATVKESDVDGKARTRDRRHGRAAHARRRARKPREPGRYATLDHAAKALDIARESIVLLKNDAHLLPLDERNMTRLLVIGANATASTPTAAARPSSKRCTKYPRCSASTASSAATSKSNTRSATTPNRSTRTKAGRRKALRILRVPMPKT